MKLGSRELSWEEEIAAVARRAGWTVYVQERLQRRPHDPSLIAVRGTRCAAIWLRTSGSRARRQPPVERFAAAPGVEVYVWRPADRRMAAALLAADAPAVAYLASGGGDDAA